MFSSSARNSSPRFRSLDSNFCLSEYRFRTSFSCWSTWHRQSLVLFSSSYSTQNTIYSPHWACYLQWSILYRLIIYTKFLYLKLNCQLCSNHNKIPTEIRIYLSLLYCHIFRKDGQLNTNLLCKYLKVLKRFLVICKFILDTIQLNTDILSFLLLLA